MESHHRPSRFDCCSVLCGMWILNWLDPSQANPLLMQHIVFCLSFPIIMSRHAWSVMHLTNLVLLDWGPSSVLLAFCQLECTGMMPGVFHSVILRDCYRWKLIASLLHWKVYLCDIRELLISRDVFEVHLSKIKLNWTTLFEYRNTLWRVTIWHMPAGNLWSKKCFCSIQVKYISLLHSWIFFYHCQGWQQ